MPQGTADREAHRVSRKGLCAVALVVALALGAGWYALTQRGKPERGVERPAAEATAEARAVPRTTTPGEPREGRAAVDYSAFAGSAGGEPGMEPVLAGLSAGVLPWEQAVAKIEKSPSAPGDKARMLFALLPEVPEEGLGHTAEQAVQWLRDTDYRAVAAPLVENPATHGAVESVLIADLAERPDAVALPTLLNIARNPSHPYAAHARDLLSYILNAERGTDWTAWQREIDTRLGAR